MHLQRAGIQLCCCRYIVLTSHHYAHQSGRGLPVYRGGIRQGGAGFLSSLKRSAIPILTDIKRKALPILKSTMKTAAKAALPHAVAGLADVIEGRNLKEVWQEKSKQAGKDALLSTLSTFADDEDSDEEDQAGSGRLHRLKRIKQKKRRKSYKRNSHTKRRKLDALDFV